MAHIRKIAPGEAKGVLKREFDVASKRAGRIWEIVAVQSLSPESLRDGMRLYRSTMYGASALTRAQREMVAIVTSVANSCDY